MEVGMHFPGLHWFFPILQGIFLGLLAMALHEAAHVIAAMAVGIKVKNIGFSWKGIYTVREPGPPEKNIFISLAGPLTNLALILCWAWSPTFGLANLCFAASNLLPIQGSDGDRVLKCMDEMQKRTLLAESLNRALMRL
jgi:Zn-dependent protease